MTDNRKTNEPLSIRDSHGHDHTQAMLEHMTRVQLRETIMAGVANDTTADISMMVTAELNARGAGCMAMPNLALLSAVSHVALATAMPRVKLHHPAHPTLQ